MRYLFVVAHPDDEVLGAGAFIHKASRQGDDVSVVILNADYEKTRENMFGDIAKSHRILGVKSNALLSYKNMSFFQENHRKMVEDIESEIRRFQPDYIFTHLPTDIHSDHTITNMVTQQASRLYQRHTSGYKVKGLYGMEILSSSNWGMSNIKLDTYESVSEDDVRAKVKALEVYQNVIRPLPHPRNEQCIKALATLRGSDIGFLYAEGFKTIWRDNI